MRVWLDDVRPMPPDFDLHCKTEADCRRVLFFEDVTHISFDHDLGPESAGTGYGVAAFIEKCAGELGVRVVDTYAIHSANPVGRKNIDSAMQSAECILRRLEQV